MVAQWRAIWSVVPGTTDPLAPFGLVSLADGTDEAWGVNMAGLQRAQTASYGYVPNPALPNVFMASAYDLGDPWVSVWHAGPRGLEADECWRSLNWHLQL